ncbi:hypothetical protein G6L37_05680 [Agrobacterium rubi]|nr:hypothetical protein [Agrobacterium rubi]NTF24849.1 hypothetical protein [Agrobacterium rubi]
MLMDIHKDLGHRQRVASIDEALEAVRVTWTGAYMEGSTGYQRSFWIHGPGEAVLVGHCWEVRGRDDSFWLRIWVGDDTTSQK